MARGFAALTKEQRKKVSAKGGKSAWERGSAHQWTSKEAKAACKKRWAKRKKK